MNKLFLYWHTVRYMKPGQVYYRIRKMLKLKSTLGIQPAPMPKKEQLRPIATMPELDNDPVFLKRFPTEELLEGKLTFLYESEQFDGDGKWEFPNRTSLWNINLHYFEFLFSLTAKYRETNDARYLEAVKAYISCWIAHNPQSAGGPGWDAYAVSLRLVNWLGCYTALREELEKDATFVQSVVGSMYEQYAFLANRLEKDLLGNHYFEDLKTLVICSVFFHDDKMFWPALRELKKQCQEQIFLDGMHFELSPMYHKIILEDVLRVAVVLKDAGRSDPELEGYLQPMLDVAYSLEEGLERIPLFNDCGNNVAKSLQALMDAAFNHFGLVPQYKPRLPDSGYYIFKQGQWKLIVDAGQPGPPYIPGHAHCDAMSFELFRAGKPVLVNCGTYAYQCADRLVYKNTAAHNTVMRKGIEQSQCWGSFRMAKRASVRAKKVDDTSITMEMRDQQGGIVCRSIVMEPDRLCIQDTSKNQPLQAYLHHAPLESERKLIADSGTIQRIGSMSYAPDYGKKYLIDTFLLEGFQKLRYWVSLED